MVDVQLVDASRYVGILDCIDPDDFSIVLKNTHRKVDDGHPCSSAIWSGSDFVALFGRAKARNLLRVVAL